MKNVHKETQERAKRINTAARTSMGIFSLFVAAGIIFKTIFPSSDEIKSHLIKEVKKSEKEVVTNFPTVFRGHDELHYSVNAAAILETCEQASTCVVFRKAWIQDSVALTNATTDCGANMDACDKELKAFTIVMNDLITGSRTTKGADDFLVAMIVDEYVNLSLPKYIQPDNSEGQKQIPTILEAAMRRKGGAMLASELKGYMLTELGINNMIVIANDKNSDEPSAALTCAYVSNPSTGKRSWIALDGREHDLDLKSDKGIALAYNVIMNSTAEILNKNKPDFGFSLEQNVLFAPEPTPWSSLMETTRQRLGLLTPHAP